MSDTGRPFGGASDAGQPHPGPDTDALNILQRTRDGLLSSEREAA